MPETKPTNRILNLDELARPFFQTVLRAMKRLLDRCPGFYLHPSKQWEYPWALEQAGLFSGCRVLDAGCGASIFPVYLAQLGCRVAALDVQLPAKPDAVAIHYVTGGLCALPFTDASFERVFCVSVIEHLAADQAATALREMHRVLTAGGKLILTTDYCQNAREPMQYQGPGQTFPVDWNVFDKAGLLHLLSSAHGFALEGQMDLDVHWETIKPRMRAFHGYPYTSVGICLVKK